MGRRYKMVGWLIAILNSDSLDLYVLVLAAVIFSVLGGLGFLGAGALASATLSLLALMALSQMKLRNQINTIYRSQQVDPFERFYADFPEELRERRVTCSDWMYVGISMARTLSVEHSNIERIIRAGGRVRILLIDPENHELLKLLHRKGLAIHGTEWLRKRIDLTLLTLDKLCDSQELQSTSGSGTLEVKLMSSVPSFGANMIDGRSSDGLIVIQHYEYQPPGEPGPILKIERRDGFWYEHFAAELERMWNAEKSSVC